MGQLRSDLLPLFVLVILGCAGMMAAAGAPLGTAEGMVTTTEESETSEATSGSSNGTAEEEEVNGTDGGGEGNASADGDSSAVSNGDTSEQKNATDRDNGESYEDTDSDGAPSGELVDDDADDTWGSGGDSSGADEVEESFGTDSGETTDDGDSDGDSLSDTGAEDAEADDDDAESVMGAFGDMLTTIALASVVIMVILVVAAIGYTRHREAEIEDGLRLDIFEYIRHNPGEHLSGIMEEFDISPSTAQHHLHILEQRSQIVSHKEQKFKRFYINGNGFRAQLPNTPYKSTISALKNPTAHRMVNYLLNHPGAGQKDVAAALGLTPSTVNWHVTRLEEANLVLKARDGKRVIYTLRDADIARKALAIAASEEGRA